MRRDVPFRLQLHASFGPVLELLQLAFSEGSEGQRVMRLALLIYHLGSHALLRTRIASATTSTDLSPGCATTLPLNASVEQTNQIALGAFQ